MGKILSGTIKKKTKNWRTPFAEAISRLGRLQAVVEIAATRDRKQRLRKTKYEFDFVRTGEGYADAADRANSR